MIIQFGICDCCNNTRILERVNGRIRATDEYAEITLILSNETIAQHGICRSCKNTLTDVDVARIMQNIRDTWATQLVGSGTKAQFDAIRSLTHDGWEKDQHKAVKRFQAIKKEKHEFHLEKVKQMRDKKKGEDNAII